MIAACPGCSARYRIEPDRLRPEGVRLRCTRCEAVFRVTPPAAAAAPATAHSSTPAAQPEAPREPAPALAPPISRPPQPAPQPAPVDRQRAVLVADPEVEQGKATASALAQWGFQPTLVHDGVEAILAIQRLLPRAVVIDAALPKMFGFQVCEIVKRNESLREIHVVLVGAIHDRTRYRRPPEEIYGADAYVERQELPGSLRSILEGFGMHAPAAAAAPAAQAELPPAPARSATPAPIMSPPATPPIAAPTEAAPAAPPAAEREPAPVVAPRAETLPLAEAATSPPATPSIASDAPAVGVSAPDLAARSAPAAAIDDDTAEKIAQAERLARIVVSDIVLYSKEKFEAAVEAGNVVEAMKPELAEGRSLFSARIDDSIQKTRDFLTEELLRVAKARGKP